jgi:hypothetical protein
MLIKGKYTPFQSPCNSALWIRYDFTVFQIWILPLKSFRVRVYLLKGLGQDQEIELKYLDKKLTVQVVNKYLCWF